MKCISNVVDFDNSNATSPHILRNSLDLELAELINNSYSTWLSGFGKSKSNKAAKCLFVWSLI